MTTITFDIAGHIRDNWSEDIPEADIERIAKLAHKLFDCSLTWDHIDQCISIARAEVRCSDHPGAVFNSPSYDA